jgi:hypothetical protein
MHAYLGILASVRRLGTFGIEAHLGNSEANTTRALSRHAPNNCYRIDNSTCSPALIMVPWSSCPLLSHLWKSNLILCWCLMVEVVDRVLWWLLGWRSTAMTRRIPPHISTASA